MDVIGRQNLRQMWDDLALTHQDNKALIFESCDGNIREFSYLEMNEQINRTANLFLAYGIQKGDKVALHLDNCPEFFFCWFGLAKIGAIMVPINARYKYNESAWIMQNCQPRMVVTCTVFLDIYQRVLADESTCL
ncbi:AMP-binding protein, partial [Vibrio parahaemolyticus]|nr:AMP-binding protein [Vibrio parahaemolyticus]